MFLYYIFIHTKKFKVNFLYNLRGKYWSLRFKGTAKNLQVYDNVAITNPQCIEIGDNCQLLQGCVLGPVTKSNGHVYAPKIKIGNRVHFGEFNRIGCAFGVTIEDDVLFAAYVHITDLGHGYQDIDVPISMQDIFSKGTITIKRGCWLGSGCRILPSVTIGENSVIGANAVVTHDIPSYSVAVGNPARVIKQYNKKTKKWEQKYPDIGAEDKYYNILRKDEMPDYSSAKAKKIKNRRRVAKLIYLFRRVEAHKSIYDQYKKYASKEELFARAKWCNNGWCKLYGLKDLKSTNFTTKQKSDMEAATAELQAILTICQKQGFRPVIVVPPFAEALNQYFSKEFLQYVLIDNIDKANNVQAHVLNYQFRNEFQDDTTLFSDGCFLLNKKGIVKCIKKGTKLMDFKKELNTLISLPFDENAGNEFIDKHPYIELNQSIRKLDTKQTEITLILENLTEMIEEASVENENSPLCEALVALADLIENFYNFAKQNNDSELLTQAEIMFSTAIKKMGAAGLVRINDENTHSDIKYNQIIATDNTSTSTSEIAYISKENLPVLIPNHLGELITPSIVYIDKNHTAVVGTEAKEKILLEPENTFIEVKRLIGTDQKIIARGIEYTPVEISSFILKYLVDCAEKYLGEKVNRAVITVPAYFTDIQRKQTLQAGEIIGLTVERIINEPTAASLDYTMFHMSEQRHILVYDLGGGTLDVTVLELFEGVVDVRASCGNNELGGKDLDKALMDYIFDKLNNQYKIHLQDDLNAVVRIKKAAEECKIALSSVREYSIDLPFLYNHNDKPIGFSEIITREFFESLISDMIYSTAKQIKSTLFDAELSTEDIDFVLLVGGSTKVPLISRFLKEINLNTRELIDPDLAVVRGAAIESGIISGDFDESKIDIVLTDVCPFSLSTTCLMNNGFFDSDVYCDILIKRNSTIPTSYQKIYYTCYDDQDAVLVTAYQGESSEPEENTFLGEFLLSGIPKAKAGKEKVKINFAYDLNGILKVSAEIISNGKNASIEINTMDAETINPEDWINSKLAKKYRAVIKKADKLLETEEGSSITGLVNKLKKELPQTADKTEIKKAYFKLIRINSPEKNPEGFQQIRKAYETLISDNHRMQYDKELETGRGYSDDYRDALIKAKSKIKTFEYKEAITELKELDKQFPNTIDIIYVLIDAYSMNENLGNATKLAERLIRLMPDDAIASVTLAKIYQKRNFINKAENEFKRAISIDEKNPVVWEAYIYFQREFNPHNMLKSFSKIEKINPNMFNDNYEMYMYAVASYMMKKQLNEDEIKIFKSYLQKYLNGFIKDNTSNSDKLTASLKLCVQYTYFEDDVDVVLIEKCLNIFENSYMTDEDNINSIKIIKSNLAFIHFENDKNIHDIFKDYTSILRRKKLNSEEAQEKVQQESYMVFNYDEIKKSLSYLKEKYPDYYKLAGSFYFELSNPKMLINLQEKYIKIINNIIKPKKAKNKNLNAQKNSSQNFEEFGIDDDFFDDDEFYEYDYDEEVKQQPIVREGPKIGRNDPCPCGSGKNIITSSRVEKVIPSFSTGLEEVVMNTREATNQYRMSNWKKMFSERVTGENVDEFCTRNGISHSQFFYWQRKLREAACNQIDETNSTLVPNGWVSCEKVEETASEQTLSIEIGSCRINVGNDFDSELLKKVFLACGATDMRKSINGLMSLVKDSFELEPFSEAFIITSSRVEKVIPSFSTGLEEVVMNTREATNQYRMSNWKKMFSERVTEENVDEFCTRNGISHSQFFYWQRKLREAACNQIDETNSTLVPNGWVSCEKVEETASEQTL
ncbi:heat shock protein 70kda [Holotrichia oblita]|nr:heat shock protein 70kda [Holotrichia oblita]